MCVCVCVCVRERKREREDRDRRVPTWVYVWVDKVIRVGIQRTPWLSGCSA